ncbi:MAG: amino acid ABC transporter substrate-binding protein [Atopobiaceae bacterium]|nr:amino acid ABC transporter substrate-binding protein [Atopobiaceae bacterium]
MRQARLAWIGAFAIALATLVVLSGCTIPFVNVEVPVNVPEAEEVGQEASDLGIPVVKLPFGVSTSVEEARQKVLSGKASTLGEGTLVVPGYLTVGVRTLTSSAPMCVQGENGILYGLDVDLAAALASEMGLKVRYVSVTDTSLLGSDCDIVMDTAPDTSGRVAVVGNYVQTASSFFYRGDTTVLVPTDLGGKSVGLQSGSNSETVLNRTGLMMSQQSFPSLNDAFDALAAGQVDFVLCEAYPGAYLATFHPGVSFAGSLELPEYYGVGALSANSELVGQLQAAYDVITANGTLEDVRSRWVGSMPALSEFSLIPDIPEGDSSASLTSPDQVGVGSNNGSGAGANAITSI